jgi:hypothetical protein
MKKFNLYKMDVSKIGVARYYLQKIEDYIDSRQGIEDEEHLVNTIQTIYVRAKNLYSDLYKVRKDEVFSLNSRSLTFS